MAVATMGYIILVIIIFYVILYFVIKAAVRNGIIEARNVDNNADNIPHNAYSLENRIAQKICSNCNKEHDCDFPKCPYCKHQD